MLQALRLKCLVHMAYKPRSIRDKNITSTEMMEHGIEVVLVCALEPQWYGAVPCSRVNWSPGLRFAFSLVFGMWVLMKSDIAYFDQMFLGPIRQETKW